MGQGGKKTGCEKGETCSFFLGEGWFGIWFVGYLVMGRYWGSDRRLSERSMVRLRLFLHCS